MISYAQPPQICESRFEDTFERTSGKEFSSARDIYNQSEQRLTQSRYAAMKQDFSLASQSLSDLKFVEDNWNSYGSSAPTEESIENARKILILLFRENLVPRKVLPSAEGGVALVFTSANQNRAVIETLNNEEAYILLYDTEGNSKTLDLQPQQESPAKLFRELQNHLRGTRIAA